MSDLITLLQGIDPLWALVTLLGGFLVGYLSREIQIEKKTIYLLVGLYLPFAIARALVFIIGGFPAVTGSGIAGVILFTIYALAIILARKIF